MRAKPLIIALSISLLSISTVGLVSASVGAANFLPNCYIPPPNGPDTATEIALSQSVAQYITSWLASYNYPYGCYYSYGTDCTVSRYRSILSTLNTYCDKSIVFSKGHRSIPQADPLHISLLDHYANDLYDNYYSNDTYSVTSSKNAFTFIWHCETANWYPEGSEQDENGHYHGMPFCWTHNSDLGYYGYDDTGDQVFLGWNNNVPPPPYPEQRGGSPQYEYEINANYNYANVAGLFWYNMCNDYTVAQSLIYLSYVIYGTSFEYTDLAEWLIVWGNVHLGLP